MKISLVDISKIILDPRLQGRVTIDMNLVSEYQEHRDQLPPVDLYVENIPDLGWRYYPGDGWHRLLAHKAAGDALINARIHEGGFEAALRHAVQANTPKDHGQKRSQEDGQRAIELYMTHSDWYIDSDPVIAKACLVSHKTVASMREKLEAAKKIPVTTMRRGADKKMYPAKQEKQQGGNSHPEQPTLPISNAEKDGSNSALVRLSISSPTESSKNVFDTFNEAQAKRFAQNNPPDPINETPPAGGVVSVAGDTKGAPEYINFVSGEAAKKKASVAESVETSLQKTGELDPQTLLPKRSAQEKQVYREQQDASREAKHQAIAAEARSLASADKPGPFSVIYADCPWEYSAKISESKSIEQQYPTLSVEELCKLNISLITAPKAVLYLWATAPLIKEALQVIDAWGFSYKTHYVWIKGRNGSGLGHWVRVDHELLFIATKGNFPTPHTDGRVSSVLDYEKGRHSEKPKEVRDHIAELYPDHPKVEIFARETADGWVSIGNEIDGRDIRDVLSEDKRQLGLPRVATPEAKPALPKEEIPKTLYAALRHLETVTFKGQSIQITCGDRSGMSVDYVIKGYFDDPVTWNAEKRIISTGEEPNYEIIVKEDDEQRSLFPCPPRPRLHRVLELIEKDFENWHVRLEFKGQPTLSSYSQIKTAIPDRDLKPYQQGSLNANHPTAVYIFHDVESSEEVGRVVLWQLKPTEGAKEPRLFRAITQLEACKTKEEFKETYDRLVVLAEGEEVVELVKRHNEMKAKLPSQENVKPEKAKKERGQKEKPSICAFCEEESPLSSMRYFDERPCCPFCWPAQEPYDYAILAAYSKGAPVVRLNMEFGPEKSEHRVTKYEEACLKKDSRLAVSNQGFATAGPLCGPCGVFLGDKRQPHSLHCNTEEHRANCHERAGQHTRHLAGIGQLGSLADLEMAEGSYLAQAKPDEVLSIQAALAVRRQELTPKEPKLSSLERGLKRLAEATNNTQCINIYDDLMDRAKNKPEDRKKINEARQAWLKAQSQTHTAPTPKRNKGRNEEPAKKKTQPKKKARK